MNFRRLIKLTIKELQRKEDTLEVANSVLNPHGYYLGLDRYYSNNPLRNLTFLLSSEIGNLKKDFSNKSLGRISRKAKGECKFLQIMDVVDTYYSKGKINKIPFYHPEEHLIEKLNLYIYEFGLSDCSDYFSLKGNYNFYKNQVHGITTYMLGRVIADIYCYNRSVQIGFKNAIKEKYKYLLTQELK